MLELLKIRQECKDLIWNELHTSLKATFVRSGLQRQGIFKTTVHLENRETGQIGSFSFIVEQSLLNAKKLQEFKEYVIDSYHEVAKKVLWKPSKVA